MILLYLSKNKIHLIKFKKIKNEILCYFKYYTFLNILYVALIKLNLIK